MSRTLSAPATLLLLLLLLLLFEFRLCSHDSPEIQCLVQGSPKPGEVPCLYLLS